MARRSAEDTRRTLLEAACRLIARAGVTGLTLEAVAAEAGVSKGGLLYHFPGKQELVAGMVGYLVTQAKADKARALADEPDRPGRQTRSYVRATFAGRREHREAAAGLVAALATDPALLAPIRADFADLQRLITADGIDPALATLLRLAADGLWFTELFDLAPPTGDDRDAVLSLLLDLTHRA